MPAKAKRFMVVEAGGGKVAVNLDLVETANLAPLSGPGLLDETVYLRLRMPSGNIVDIADQGEQNRVRDALGIKYLAEQEVSV